MRSGRGFFFKVTSEARISGSAPDAPAKMAECNTYQYYLFKLKNQLQKVAVEYLLFTNLTFHIFIILM